MAKTEKPKRKRYTTPKGESLFAHIVHVDYGTEQYPDQNGSYKLTVALDAADADKLRDMLSNELDEAQAYAAEKFADLKPAARTKLGEVKFNELGTDEYDREENLTGRVLFRFKTNAFYTDRQGVKKQRSVPLFDSMSQGVSLKDEPGNGSIIRASFTTAPYFVDGQGMGGLSLYLDAVQIIKLNKPGARSASDYGFGEEEEGGFCADDLTDDSTTDDSTTPSAPLDESDVPF